jgi:DNA-binding GntR family transcriptional regulator
MSTSGQKRQSINGERRINIRLAMDATTIGSALTRTLPLQLADRLAAAIIEEQIAPGERLKEVDLGRSFGVSRATVREALRLLEQRCLVTIVPQRGAQVTKLERRELEDLFEIRAVLLGLASRRVARIYTPDMGAALTAGLAKLKATVTDGTAYARASADLVGDIARLSGNVQLAAYVADFALRIGRYARLGLSTPERRARSLATWIRLVRAIAAGDGEKAEALHRQLSTENLIAALTELERRERQTQAAKQPL